MAMLEQILVGRISKAAIMVFFYGHQDIRTTHSVAAAFTARNLLTPSAFYTAVANGSETVTSAYRAFAHDASAPGFQLGCYRRRRGGLLRIAIPSGISE